jgi:hypothetical protein
MSEFLTVCFYAKSVFFFNAEKFVFILVLVAFITIAKSDLDVSDKIMAISVLREIDCLYLVAT